jgi:hypothetical protein
MNWIFIGFFLPTLALYVHYSRREGSFLNTLTGLTLLKCVTEFVLEPVAYSLDVFNYTTASFFQLYLASFIGYSMLVLGARRSQTRTPVGNVRVVVPAILPWIFLGLAVLLYLPIFIEFRDFLLDPRYIYEQTRTGYGIQFFGSALLTNCALILFLLSTRRFHVPFIVLLIVFTMSKGSKGQLLTDILIYAIWAVYVLRKRFDVKRTIVGIVLVSTALAGAFVLNFRGQIDSLVLTMAGYSDYNRNATLILEDQNAPTYYGRLSFENVFYSKIPRALWPDKPKNFGAFSLAETYMPRLFELDQGAPSFGIGIYFADFGMLAYLFIGVVNFVSGRMLRYFIRLCERQASVFSFTMVLFCSDVMLLPVGVGYFLLEHLLLAAVLQKIVDMFGKHTGVPARQSNAIGGNA